MKRALITGPAFRDRFCNELMSLGFDVINGSRAALATLGLPPSEQERDLTEAEITQLIGDVSIYLFGGLEPASAKVIDAGLALELIGFLGTGWSDDGCVDPAAAERRRIVVTNTPHANAPSVAEMAIGLIIALERKIFPMNSATKAGSMRPVKRRDVAGRQLGIIGLGHIGGQVARHAVQGFGMNVVYAGPSAKPDLERTLGLRRVPIDELLASSDYVSLHTPAAKTHGLIGPGEIALMKNDALLINLSAPEVVDGLALVTALENGAIGAAAVDGVYKEPRSLRDRFLALGDDRLIVLPRSAWLTDDSYDRMATMALASVRDLLSGKRPLLYQVNLLEP